MENTFDVLVIGGGCVGLATAYKLNLKYPHLKIAVLEKENEVAKHQTGRNSGVIHSGIYYKPGSLKATNCIRGYHLLIKFCKENGIPFELCGKIIVATAEHERAQLSALAFDLGARYILFPPLQQPVIEDLVSGLLTATTRMSKV